MTSPDEILSQTEQPASDPQVDPTVSSVIGGGVADDSYTPEHAEPIDTEDAAVETHVASLAAAAHNDALNRAHESFRLRIDNAYSELKVALDTAWHVYLRDRGLLAEGAQILSDLGGTSHARGPDPTAAV